MKTRLVGAIVAIVLAVAGTLVLTSYVRGADARAFAGAELVTVYVVSAPISAGTTAADAESMIVAKRVPAVAAATDRVTQLQELEGKVAEVALIPGEQLLKARWVSPGDLAASGDVSLPDGMQAITIALPVEHVVGGAVKAGDTVGIVISATARAEDGTDIPITKQIHHKVLVLAILPGTSTQPSSSGDSPAEPVDTLMVTLALATPALEKLVWGQEFGSVWLTSEPAAADESGSSRVDLGKVFE
ncbi:MAG: Flp pilus assembly protein CpaB [Rhodoglobus sp.]